MAISAYNFAGSHVARAGQWGGFDPQKGNMGMLELYVGQLNLGVPKARDILILALKSFMIPGRSVGQGEIRYLNGVAKHPTQVEALGNISAAFRDYPNERVRDLLIAWHGLVYNEETGYMTPPSALKIRGMAVLFKEDGTYARTAKLHGLWPTKLPDTSIDFDTAEPLMLEVEFSVDSVIWVPQARNER